MHTNTRLLAGGALIAFLISGCGGGGGGSSDTGSDQFLSDNASTNSVSTFVDPGIFATTVEFADGTSSNGFSIVSSTGRVIAAFSLSNITVTRINFGDDGRYSDPATDVFFDGSWVTIDGVAKGQALSRRVVQGTSETNSGEFRSSYRLEREDAFSDQGASLSRIDRTFFQQNTATISTSLTIDSNGALTGSDTTGCVFEGAITVPDARYNIYEVTMELRNCGSTPGTPANLRNGSFSGLALYDQQAGELGAIITNGKVVGSFFGT